jgi:predicted amidohydrolase
MAERLYRCGLLLERARPEHRAEDAPAAAHQGAQRERRLGAGSRPDDHDSALRRERLEIGGEIRRADQFEHDVGATVRQHEAESLVRLRRLDAEFREPSPCVVGARRREHAGAREARDLHGGRPDAAARTVHEQDVADPEARLDDDRVVRGHERLRHGCGLLLVEALGHADDVALVRDNAVGQPPAADEAEDAVSDLPVPHLLAAGDHVPGNLETWNILGRTGRGRIAPGPLGEVGRIERRILDGHDDLAASRNRVRPRLQPQLLAGDHDRSHRATVSRPRRTLHGVRIALAQLDSQLGDVDANELRARETVAQARAGRADLVVFPELHLSGYALGAVEHDTSETAASAAAVADGVAALFGFHERDGERRYNSAVYVEGGAPLHVHRKLYLVDYPPFEEDAHFSPGETMRAFDTALGRVAVLICNDAWQPFLPALAVADGAEILLVPAASSTAVQEAEAYWRDLTRFYARMLECFVVFVNRVGAEAGFTFWGGSHVVDPLGEIVAEAPVLEESLLLVDLDLDRVTARRREQPLVTGLRPHLLCAELERLARRRIA